MLFICVILAVGCPAIWIDARTNRIPNVLVLAALLMACAIQLLLNGTAGIIAALGGAAVGLAFLLPLHLAGAMGAGDVKFMAALSALLGTEAAIVAGALTLIAGAALAVVLVTWRLRPTRDARLPAPVRVPYAAAIVAGACVASLVGR